MSKKLINLTGISKSYGDHVVLDDLNLYIRENEFITLLGPSGCGKTTTLRMIAGFEKPDGGEIYFDGREVKDIPVNKRNIGMVFQSYALFPQALLMAESHLVGGYLKYPDLIYLIPCLHLENKCQIPLKLEKNNH